jgi:RNA polymerase sigma-70 factor (ECF subfamily)
MTSPATGWRNSQAMALPSTLARPSLAQLPEMERAVLVLYHQEDCSYEGIALALSLPLNTVRTHLHRGRKRLSELVKTQLDRRSMAMEARR